MLVMPIEKRFFRVCGKTGRIVGFSRKWRLLEWLFPVFGVLALAWYLVRVIPKPSRANYPCQRAALPVALGGLAYFIGLFGVLAGLRHARRFARRDRWALALVCLAAGLACAVVVVRQNETDARAASTDTPNAPIGIARGINPGRVVWSYDPAACSWSGNKDGTHWWDPNKVDQARADAMLSAALRSLAGTTNDADAWDALFRSFNRRRGNGDIGYAQSPRKAIAVKINQNPCNANNTNNYALNGVTPSAGDEYSITGNPHLILALIKQLTAVQVAQTNIIILDASGLNRGWGGPRTIADNIYQYIHPLYPGVRFVDGVGQQGRELATWPGTNNIVYPLNASGETTSRGLQICRQILEAGFFINMAILKDHDDGPTLCGKNNYGSISGQRHGPMYGNGTPTYYSNLVPLMGHRELGDKTLLFMIDALYGASSPNTYPTKWKMTPFNTSWPSSVFLSEDGVAIDSVGFDFLNAEWGQPQNTDYYLHEAAYVPGANGVKLSGVVYRPNAGSSAFLGSLGTQEHWNNSTNKQYSRNLGTGNGIELVKLLPGVPSVSLVVPGTGPFAPGTNLLLQAVVNSNTNPISQVAFYRGAQLLGTSSGTYCSITWSNVPQGNHVLKAVATDSSGLSATSSPVALTVSAVYAWDADPATGGAQDGGGTWNLVSSNWWYGSTNVAWDNAAPPTTAILGMTNAPAGTITLGTNITAGSLTFTPAGSGDYTIAGGGYTLTLAGVPVVSVATNGSPVISAPVAGAGFSKADSGTLFLTGANTCSGAISVNGGTLVLAGNNLSSTAAATVAAGATLRLGHANAVKGSLTLNNGSTLQLRADSDTIFAPASLAFENAADVNYFDVNCADGLATGKTLTLSGALAYAASSDQTIKVTGGHGYTLALGAISATASSHDPYRLFNINAVPGIGVVIASFTSGNYGNYLNLAGGGKVTVAGNLGNTSNGSTMLFVNGGTTATLRGLSVKSNSGDAYRYFVPNGTLVVDNSGALINNTTGTGLTLSLFVLGAATNIVGSGFSAPGGFLIASNNACNCSVYLGDASFAGGGLTLGATVTNYVSDGDTGFANTGTMTIGGQNTSGINTFANPIILGWTANRGKSVTLVAATGGQVAFAGGIRRNGADTTAGVTIGDGSHGGIVRLAGANTYGGATRIVNGTLLVSSSLGGGAVIVQSGGALGGTGTIGGLVTVQSGGVLSPGDGLGTLTMGNSLTLVAGSQVRMEINANTGGGDKVSGLASVAYGGALVVSNVAGAVTPGQRFQLFSAASRTGTFSSISPAGPGAGLAWTFNPAGGELIATATNQISLTCAAGPTNLTLSWPPDHLGWSVLTQTNHPAQGLSVDPGDWMRIAGTETNTQFTLPLAGTNPPGFYRLVYP